MSLPVYNSEQMQQWDAFTIVNEPITSVELMERAASLAAKSILGRNAFTSAAVFCGPGNNGGDGLVIARLLSEEKKKVTVYTLSFGTETEDFKANFKRLPKSVKVVELSEKMHKFLCSEDLIVDAIFGSGLNRAVKGWIADVIQKINALNGIKIAIDIPSGLFAADNHENESFPAVFEAQETLSFMSPKMPFFFPSYAGFVGKFRILDIGLHTAFTGKKIAYFITKSDIHINQRKTFSHKGINGALTIIGSLGDMSGAVIIAAKSAFRSGSGYVYAACDENSKSALNTSIPEVIWQNVNQFELPKKSTAIAIGPGMGTTELAYKLLNEVLCSDLPLVLDADALNLLSERKNLLSILPENSILTPHIGELKRLVGTFSSDEELLAAQKEMSIKHKIYIIQKGPFSKLTTPDGQIFINSSGNPGMGSAGMGDALTGIIGSLLSQGYSAKEAAIFGMYLHGYAADLYARDHGQIGLLASDVISKLQEAINQFV